MGDGSGASFVCGMVEVPGGPAGAAPDWEEFGERVEFLREVRGLRARFLAAERGENGAWLVPFLAVRADPADRTTSPEWLFAHDTPWHVPAQREVDLAHASRATLATLRSLACDETPPFVLADVAPGEKPQVKRPEDVFCDLVGMASQKERLMKIARVVERCGRDAQDGLHMVFVGNPGTGKTELAERLVRYLDLLGVTDGTGRLVRAGEADLVARYVGHTAPKVRALVRSALGGVLFIDEFYAVASAPHFGQEAVDCLVDQLERHRHDLVCVVAGYPHEIDRTLDMNPGLRDRFAYRVEFPDYSVAELEEIFRGFANERGFELRCEGALPHALKELKAAPGFSNARSARRLLDHAVCEACWAHDGRYLTDKDVERALAGCAEGTSRVRTGFGPA